MTQWEYIEVETQFGRTGDDFFNFAEWMKYLNRLGEDGWELLGDVSVFRHYSSNQRERKLALIAKRPKN